MQSQYDSWQLRHVLGKRSNVSSVNDFGAKIKAIVKSLVSSAAVNGTTQHGAYLNSCEHHCMSCAFTDDNVWNSKEFIN